MKFLVTLLLGLLFGDTPSTRVEFAPPPSQLSDTAFETEDGVTIKATLGVPANPREKNPAVILIHQGGSDRSEWDDFRDALLLERYVVIAYDVRGHGASDSVESIRELFDNPDLAPRDLSAAIEFLQSQDRVDAERIAVVGSSIGGNLAAVASSEMGIKTAVAISAKVSAVRNLSGKQSFRLQSVFYISSEGDQGGKRALWAKALYDQTAEPRRLEIVEGSEKHGVGIFEDSPQIGAMILEWLKDTL